MRRILLTGATGLLGQYLVSLAGADTASGNRWLLLSRDAEWGGKVRSPPFSSSSLDLTDARALRLSVRKFCPEVVIHTAAHTDIDACEDNPASCQQQNTEAVKALLAAVADRDVFFIHISTDFVFSGDRGPYREEDEARPINAYGHSKWLAEDAVRDSRLRSAVLRTSLLYGDPPYFSRPNFFVWIREALRRGGMLRMVCDQYRTPTYAKDLARVCHALVGRQQTGVFHIAGEALLTPYEAATRVRSLLLAAPKDALEYGSGGITPVSAASFHKNGAPRPVHSGLSIEKAKKHLNYEPTPLHQAVRELLQAAHRYPL